MATQWRGPLIFNAVAGVLLFAIGALSSLGAGLVLAIITWAYIAPATVAFARRVPNRGSVAVIDFFLGWTVAGWIVALAMAVRSKPPAAAAGPVQP